VDAKLCENVNTFAGARVSTALPSSEGRLTIEVCAGRAVGMGAPVTLISVAPVELTITIRVVPLTVDTDVELSVADSANGAAAGGVV
jgi:hypothetical protein